MAGEGDESRNGRMDLNLYLGLPRSPRPRALDLGSDLALGSIPHPSSSSSSPTAAVVAGDSHPPMDVEASADADSLVPYSPSNVPYDADLPSIDPATTADQRPYTPSYIPIQPIDEATQEIDFDIPYSPTRVRSFQFSPESDEQMAGDSNTNSPYPYRPSLSASSPGVVDESYIPTPPPSAPRASTPQGRNGGALNGGEHRRHDHGSSSRGGLLQYQLLRFQRLIESQNRLGVRRFRLSSNSSGGERSDLGRQLLPAPEPALQNSMGKTKVVGEGNAAEGSEKETEEKSKDAANFDCNVCFDMAKEPVVTSCGHLFCWPCLYQWLYVYSKHKECPICKGEVVESNLIPIYGRGSLEVREESIQEVEGQLGLKIPPRPRGNRFESFRQQMEPITRRLEEMSWRRLFTERMLNGDRLGDASMHEMFEIGHRRLLATLRAGLMQREEGNMERGLNAGEGLMPRNNTTDPQNSHASSPLRDGMGFLQRFSLDLGRVVERLATSGSHHRAAVSSANPPNPPNPQILVPSDAGLHVAAAIAADQASPSSTMAVIQGDTATTNDTAAEPNNAGSSSSLRRRARSSTCISSDVDGGGLHACKRRRLN